MEVSGDYIVIDYPEEESSDEELYISIPFSDDYEESASEDYIPVVDEFGYTSDNPEFYDVSEEFISDSEIMESYESFSESEPLEEEQSSMILSLDADEISTDLSSSSIETSAEMSVETVSCNSVSSFEPDFAIVLLFSVGAIGGIILGSLFWWRFRT